MEDVEDARELVEQRMRATGMEESIFDRILDLLERFDTDREKLFEEMLDKLDAPGWDGLRDRWTTNCEQGDALLERIEEQLTDVLDDSQATGMSGSELMAAVGPRDLLSGERKIWEQNRKGEIADVAVLIGKILDTDLQVIKKCEEDLKKVRDDDKVVEALIVKNFGSVTAAVKNLAVKYSITGVPRLIVLLMKDSSAKQLATDTFKQIEKLMEENYNAAKQKRIIKQTVLNNIEMLSKAKEQLSEEWIDQLYAKGESAAKALRDAGRTGDYEATDWEGFGSACITALAARRDAAKEQSRKVFAELLPAFIEENVKAFAALTDDWETLKNWTDELEDTFESIEEVLDAEEEFRAGLAEGDYSRAVGETLSTVRLAVSGTWKLITERSKAADDEVKK